MHYRCMSLYLGFVGVAKPGTTPMSLYNIHAADGHAITLTVCQHTEASTNSFGFVINIVFDKLQCVPLQMQHQNRGPLASGLSDWFPAKASNRPNHGRSCVHR